LETLQHFMLSLDPALIYAVLFLVAFIENLFPPAPSDMIIVFGGSLIGLAVLHPVPAVLFSTAGSTLGFMTMYQVGVWFDRKVIHRRKFRFLPEHALEKVEDWFQKHGMWIIVVNRFLAGTRAVVSLFAGMSRLRLLETTILCFISALVWNSILLTMGYLLGHNWEVIGFYLRAYSRIITIVVGIILLTLVVQYVILQRRRKSSS
jgi:membrane protein DedA with SNARE-associated domain